MDIAVIGAGPAGMSAAVYLKRAGFDVAVFEGEIIGGQMTTTPEIQNVVGFGCVAGWELSKMMAKHLKDLDIPIIGEQVIGFDMEDNVKKIISPQKVYPVKSVIIANGAKRRKLGCEGEDRLSGRGVSYCAVCDGDFFKNKTVTVVGGGNTALEDALYLSKLCNKVYLIHRRDEFRGQRSLIEAVVNDDKIEIITPATVEKIQGNDKVEKVIVNCGEVQREIATDGVFIAVGLVSDNEIYSKALSLDEGGYIITDDDMTTDVQGVYAAGDTRHDSLRQIITAMSDGAVAANSAIKYMHSISCII